MLVPVQPDPAELVLCAVRTRPRSRSGMTRTAIRPLVPSSASAMARAIASRCSARHGLKFTTGGFSAPGCDWKYGFSLKRLPNIPAMKTVGNRVALGIERARGIVILPALESNAIFGALELSLERLEVFGRPKLRVVLDDRQQTGERRAELILRGRVLCEVLRVIDGILDRFGRDLPDAGARFGDGFVGARFEVRRTFDGRHEIGNQIGAALIDVLHLAPLSVDSLAKRDERVVRCRRRKGATTTTIPITTTGPTYEGRCCIAWRKCAAMRPAPPSNALWLRVLLAAIPFAGAHRRGAARQSRRAADSSACPFCSAGLWRGFS